MAIMDRMKRFWNSLVEELELVSIQYDLFDSDEDQLIFRRKLRDSATGEPVFEPSYMTLTRRYARCWAACD